MTQEETVVVDIMLGMRTPGAVVVVVVVKALAVVAVHEELFVRWRNIAREYDVCCQNKDSRHRRPRLCNYILNSSLQL